MKSERVPKDDGWQGQQSTRSITSRFALEKSRKVRSVRSSFSIMRFKLKWTWAKSDGRALLAVDVSDTDLRRRVAASNLKVKVSDRPRRSLPVSICLHLYLSVFIFRCLPLDLFLSLPVFTCLRMSSSVFVCLAITRENRARQGPDNTTPGNTSSISDLLRKGKKTKTIQQHKLKQDKTIHDKTTQHKDKQDNTTQHNTGHMIRLCLPFSVTYLKACCRLQGYRIGINTVIVVSLVHSFVYKCVYTLIYFQGSQQRKIDEMETRQEARQDMKRQVATNTKTRQDKSRKDRS